MTRHQLWVGERDDVGMSGCVDLLRPLMSPCSESRRLSWTHNDDIDPADSGILDHRLDGVRRVDRQRCVSAILGEDGKLW